MSNFKNSMCLFLRCLRCLGVYKGLKPCQINVSSKTPLIDTYFTRHLLVDSTRHRFSLDTFPYSEGVLQKKPENHYPCGSQRSLDTKTPKTPFYRPYWKKKIQCFSFSGDFS